MRWMAAALLTVLLAGAGTAAGAQPPQPPQPPEVEQAQALLREGKAREAWQLLSPLQARYAGNLDFDLALATAAIDAGHANLATFALERVVIMQPGNTTARLELVRALYALRDYERAEREIQFILEGNPPPKVRDLLQQYRDRIREAPGAAPPGGGWIGYVEGGVGHDTNANVATTQGSIFVPSLGSELLIDRPFQRDSDNFATLGGGLEYAHPISGRLAASVGADLHVRSYAELETLDTRVVDLNLGLRQRLDERDALRYTLRHNYYELGHAAYRRMQSGAVAWSRLFGERARLGVVAEGYRIRYLQEDFVASSSDLAALGASGAYLVDAATRTIGVASIYVGHDNAVDGRADGDRRIYGGSAGMQRAVATRVQVYASLAVLYSRYQDENADFGLTRRDRQVDLALGASWEPAKRWSLRPHVARTRNHSNIEINDYRRTEAWFTLRREWD